MSTPIKIKELKLNKTEYSKIKKNVREKREMYNMKQTKNNFNQRSILCRPNDYLKLKKKFSSSPKSKHIHKIIMPYKIDNRLTNLHKSNTAKNIYKSRNNLKSNLYKSKITFSTNSNFNVNNSQYTISIINTEELTKKNNDISNYSKIQDKKLPVISKKFNWSLQKEKYKSMLYHLDMNSKIDINKIENRYEPKIKDFINEKYYSKLDTKNNDFSNCKKEIKVSFKNTKLIIAIFDYLNKSITKYRRHYSVIADKAKLEEIERKKRDKEILDKESKNHFSFLVNDILKISKILTTKRNTSLPSKSNKSNITNYNYK